MSIASEQKDEIYKKIVDIVIAGLENGQLEEYEARMASQFCLEKIEAIESESQLVEFYEELSNRWPVFEILVDDSKNIARAKAEEEVSEGALTLLKHGKIDNALKLAKTATQK